ncbi:hypothetical protein B0J18DRAFT_418327 [Chaetomium sp. MPI-SDFR-AT-0129]|uniref:Uncharacterized protein n=1 Tax=Dichotomopilus funicola TaxID=1934379 RepID=A0AAN6V8I8_9PEZI|nr:hypothetical protein B0J18DRAFT_418327 [Chaetomium sp. MPI-SDFR-AT-0129]KAK4146740.1 hypothetical protein C8A04DRAFT_34638 [Dichotomopilus funicola]
MPVPVAAKVGIVAASVVVAAAIAIYEIPEVRRTADDVRRRIAIALHSLGENIDTDREPRFNRPEDAEGFYQTHDIDADEETRRRQREELMYWNMHRTNQRRHDRSETQPRSRGSSFDDFLSPDQSSDSGTFVYNTGANAWGNHGSDNLRRRGNKPDGARSLNAAMLSNPFGDEHGIELDECSHPVSPPHTNAASDIYDATPRIQSPKMTPIQPAQSPAAQAKGDVLFDFEAHGAGSEYGTALEASQYPRQNEVPRSATPTTTTRSVTLERELAEDEFMTAGQDDRTTADAYASIQAWAQDSSNTGFYSPLPETPDAPLSDMEMVSEGQLTPTDSGSVAGSGVDVANDAVSATEGRDFDVMSESDAGAHTPGSWSEVGSVISESESAARA